MSITNGLARALATTGGLGDRLPAPGTTAGSFPAIALWLTLALWLPQDSLLLVTAVLAVAAATVGIWCANVEIRRRQMPDPGAVVIDEVAGQWVTCCVPLVTGPIQGTRSIVIVAAAAFLLFRVFDVVKPWPVDRLENLPGGWGVMADDLAAGLIAGALVALGTFRFLPHS